MMDVALREPSQVRDTNALKAFRLEDRSRDWGEQIWSLTFDLPGEKVNKLGEEAMSEIETLLSCLESLGKEGKVQALILLSGKAGNFIAGADINLIASAKGAKEAQDLSRKGQLLLERWEDLPFPTIAAIDGACLGGGFELSLASQAIVASDHSAVKIGLPEVMLGLLPGMGGCIRLSQKVGLATALDLILTGKSLNGKRAHRSGVIEACVPKENFEENVAFWVKKNLSKLKAGVRLAREPKLGGMGGAIGKALELTPMGRSVILSKAKDGVLSKTKGHYPSPLEAIEIIRSTGVSFGARWKGKKRTRAMERESEGFGKVAATDVSRNLIRIFFLTESVKKSNGLPNGNQVRALDVRHSAVLGAGVMGGGIAQLFADKSIPTRMKDINTPALETGVQAALQLFKKKVKRRRMTKREMLQKMNLISPVLDFSGFGAIDTVVEAVIEKMDIKKSVLKDLENYVSSQCVIATNTSSLSVTEMQTVLSHPERFVGMHFFNPVHRMPLIEVIRGEKTSDEAVATIFEFSKKLGKTPIVVKDGAGFLVNRLLCPYMNEAGYLVKDGVPVEEIDRALLKFGMPMGPLELVDEVGVDVGHKVLHILHEAFGDRMMPFGLTDKLISAERLGKKNGKGIYEYEQRKKTFNKKVYEIVEVSPRAGLVPEQEIVERCILPMINEAARCLDEGIVHSASDVDLGMIMGTGFPPFRGGLLRYADSVGLDRLVERMKAHQSKFGSRFEPSSPLLKRAESRQKFYSDES